MLSEEVEMAKLGDEEALIFIVEQIRPELWSLSGNWPLNHWDREDAVQKSFENICKKLPGLRNNHYFRPWCRRILENICNDIYKTQKTWNDFVPLKGDEECLVATWSTNEEWEGLEEYLALMSEEMAETFRLRYASDLPVKAIAQIQNIPEGTVSSRLHRGKQIMRTHFRLYKGD